MKSLNKYLSLLLMVLLVSACEMDNYDGPDAQIDGKIYDHNGQPLRVGHGSSIIRIREISWLDDPNNTYVGNQTLKVMYDGTYRNTKMFSGEYLMMPYAGAFFPYDEDTDEAGDQVKIKGKITKDFTVTPYLSVEWVKEPTLTADKYIECSVKFKRNQKDSFKMPDVREAWLYVTRTITGGENMLEYYPSKFELTNDMEGEVLIFKTTKPMKYNGMNVFVHVGMNCQTVPGDPETNYPGMGASNYTSIVKVAVP